MNEKIGIECCAVRCNGKIFALDRPNRHNNCLWFMNDELGGKPKDRVEQGFLTSYGEFVDRETANNIALFAGQIKEKNLRELFSEDLWDDRADEFPNYYPPPE
mgnify:CR=1 FL=1